MQRKISNCNHETKMLIKNLSKSFNLHGSRASILLAIILGILKSGTTNLAQVAQHINSSATLLSIYRRIQRFFAEISFDVQKLAGVIYNQIFAQHPDHKHVLVFDRTNWKLGKVHINLLFLGSVINKTNCLFLFVKQVCEQKKGCSTPEQRIDVLDQFIRKFGKEKIGIIMGDREFIGQKWIQHLQKEVIPYVFRLREKNQYILIAGQYVLLEKYFSKLKNGRRQTVHGVLINKDEKRQYKGTITARRNQKGELMILLHSDNINDPVALYKTRWSIEVSFKNYKSNGTGLEDSSIKDPDRMLTLVNVLMLVHTIITKIAVAFCEMPDVMDFIKRDEDLDIEKIIQNKDEEAEKIKYDRISAFKKGHVFIKNAFLHRKKKTMTQIYSLINQGFSNLINNNTQKELSC